MKNFRFYNTKRIAALIVAGALTVNMTGCKKDDEKLPVVNAYTIERLYQVQSGDTYSEIVEKFGTQVDVGDYDLDNIQVGETIKIIYKYPEEEIDNYTRLEEYNGEDLSELAQEKEISYMSLLYLNKDRLDEDHKIITDEIRVPNFSPKKAVQKHK